MVMDATPSPQSVGREFVRQYYTLLNKAPHHLHRFYNHQSSFVHGGLEPPTTSNAAAPRDCLVIGQKQIHNKIQQLNFRDCHAKISQVDAQATLGNGVVVQVTGELSNDGQPMRRFTQTFVLAAQAPKKYYVHNDIFRYQDLVWDEDGQQVGDQGEQDSDARSEEVNEVDAGVQNVMDQQQQQQAPVELQQQQVHMVVQQQVQQEVPQVQQAQGPQGQIFYNAGAVKPAPGMFQTAQPANVPMNGLPQQPQPVPVAAAVQPVVNDQVHHRVPAQQQPVAAAPAPSVVNQQPQVVQATPFPEAPVTVVDTKPAVVEEVVKVDKVAAPAAAPVVEEPVEKKPPQPETFASLVKSGGGGVSSGRIMASRGPGAAPVAIQPVSVVSAAGQATAGGNTGSNHTGGSGSNQGGSGAGGVRERRSSTNNNSGSQYVDSQQLFVGNIPHHATEEELKAMFSNYGVVLDLRIFAKQSNALPGGKGSSGRVPQNYGFVTFKDSESAQAVLANPVS